MVAVCSVLSEEEATLEEDLVTEDSEIRVVVEATVEEASVEVGVTV